MKWFSRNGYEVHVCAKNDFPAGEECVIPGCDRFFDVPFCRKPFSRENLAAYNDMRRIISENGYDLIICNTPVAAFVTRMAAAAVRFKGKVIYTCHGFHFYKGAPLSAKVFYIAEKLAAPFTHAIITINDEDLASARALCDRCECFKVHGLGVDIRSIMEDKSDRSVLRREFDIPDDAFLLMSVSEINKNKNVFTAVRAFAKAAYCRNDMYYLAVGGGESLDKCVTLASELGVADKVIFTGYRADAKVLLHMADAFIFPSYREGLGLAAIEAMAAGLPLIASDIRGVREYAVSGENSLLFAPSDIDGFAAAIKMLAADPELREKMGNAAKAAALPFDMTVAFREITDIYGKYAETQERESEKWQEMTT